MQDGRDPSATQITIGLYLVSAFAVLCMGWIPGAEARDLHHYSYAGAPVLVACSVVAAFGQRIGSLRLIQGSLIVSNLLISVTVAALTHAVGDAYEVEIFYLLPLLLAAHFHGTRFVALSIAVAAIGHPIALMIGYRSTASADLIAEALARSIPVGAVMGSVAVLVLRMRQRDRRQRLLLHGQATTDPLTKLMNRRGLRDAIDAQRVSPGSSSVMMVDLDRFKVINDSEGHDVGDRVLCDTAAALAGATTDDDVVARFGGEEFVVVLAGRSADEALRLADSVTAALRGSTASIATVTASYGITEWIDGEPFSLAVKRADEAVYEAKAAGRARTCVRLADATSRRRAPASR